MSEPMLEENNKNPAQKENPAPAVVVIRERGWSSIRWKITLGVLLFISVVALVVGLIIGDQVKAWITPPPPPVAVINEMTDEDIAAILQGKSLKIQSVVLGDTRTRKELLVMERDTQVTSLWESAWGDLDIFRKSKEIVSWGTGYYAVDLTPIDDQAIVVDHTARTVTITIPNAFLKSIEIDEEKTEFGQTQHGLLSFGELKLTQEQSTLLQSAIKENMRKDLNGPDQLALADLLAVKRVAEVYQPLISAIGADYTVVAQLSASPGTGASSLPSQSDISTNTQ